MKLKLFITLLVLILSACGGSSNSSSGAGSSEKENLILVLGDSIGAGNLANVAFPDVIASLTGIPVVNESTPGISAEEGVGRATSLIEQHNPSYIVALLGTNNALGALGEAEGAIRAMEKLAQICTDNEITCIIGTLPPITLASSLNGNVKKINLGYRAIDNVRIADNFAVMNDSLIGPDGIHPNDEGETVIGQTFSAQFP